MISVFGASGFVGANFVNHSNHKTRSIPRENCWPESSDVLYLISTTHNYNVFDNPLLDIKTNLIHLMNVLTTLTPEHTFNFVSSWFVYGREWGRESSSCYPKGFYSITKYCAEQLIESYCTTHKIPYRIFRLANVYGPGDHNSSQKKNAMQWLVNKVKRGEGVELYYGGNSARDYIHVRDVVRALDLCMDKAPLSSITNIGSGEKYKMKCIIDYTKKITGSKSEIIAIEPPEFHKQVQVKDFGMTVMKLEELGFKSQITIEEGISELCK